MEELISIIMPAFNVEKYIREAIQSVINQSYKKWELLIINDGSLDRTEEIILSFNDERIVYLKQANKGSSAARNKGLNKMKGSYFCFLDADDSFTNDSLEKRLSAFTPEIAFVDGIVLAKDINLKKVYNKFIPSFYGPPIDALVSLNGSCFTGLTWMIKKNPIRKYEFNEQISHSEDLLFFIAIANDGIYKAINNVILNYRKGHLSAMSNLKGQEKGYFEVLKHLSSEKNISKKQQLLFKSKIKSIMFKSYLKKYCFISAINVLFREK